MLRGARSPTWWCWPRRSCATQPLSRGWARGWLTKAQELLAAGEIDVVEPARSYGPPPARDEVSTRVFLIDRRRFRESVLLSRHTASTSYDEFTGGSMGGLPGFLWK